MNSTKHFSESSIRLWQLISPTLPIGAYAYSQGLEYAVDCEWIKDEETASQWILGQVLNNLSQLDVPVFFRLYEAWQKKDFTKIQHWNAMVLALRESAELRQEDVNLGNALVKVLQGLSVDVSDNEDEQAFVTIFAFACVHWRIDVKEAAHGLLWSWCENQVASAIKVVPLGQTSGQKIMSQSIEIISKAINKAELVEDDEIGLLAPGLAIASALHETQYSRLFRS